MLDTSARLLLLLRLLSERRFWEGEALCQHLEVSDRTLRRDIDRLRSLGYRVDAAPGVGGGYRLGPGREVPPLPFDDEEAAAVALGLRLSATGPLGGLEAAAVRALGKLTTVMPQRLQRRLTALSRTALVDDRRAPRLSASLLVDLAEACDERRLVHFGYCRRDGERTLRVAEAHRLVFVHGHWYLVAFDEGRADWRTFRVDRITPPEVARGATYAPRALPADDLVAHVSAQIASAAWPLEAEVMLFATDEDIETLHKRGPVERVDDGRWRMRLGGDDERWMALYLLMLGVEFEVLRPVSLQQALRRLGAQCARSAGPAAPC